MTDRMMYMELCVCVSIFLLAVPWGSAAEPPAGNDLEQLVTANNAFGMGLFRELAQVEENLFFSPFSVSKALTLTLAGARGDTEAEMAKTLCYPLPQIQVHEGWRTMTGRIAEIQAAGSVELYSADSIWPQAGPLLDNEYVSLLQTRHQVQVTPVDYMRNADLARTSINHWVKVTTKDKITDLIRPGDLDESTRLTLVNAVYFKGFWQNQFDPRHTVDADFYKLDGSACTVPMMTRTGSYPLAVNDQAHIVELGYRGGDLSMILIVPKSRTGLPAIEKQLTESRLSEWLAALRNNSVCLKLPKFKMTWGTRELNDALIRLGMRKAFTAAADFSGMTGERDMFIHLVLHKAFIDVNEEGSEAAAATAVTMRKSMSISPPPVQVTADRPFLFLIRDTKTGQILFMGRQVNPQNS